MVKLPIQIKRGDTREIPFTVLDENGVPMESLASGYLTFVVKVRASDDDDDAVMVKTVGDGITITSEEEGTIVVAIEPEDTSGFAATKRGLLWDLQLVTAAGKVYTLEDGIMNVKADISRNTS